MALVLKVSQSDLYHQVEFSEPAFELFGEPLGLQRKLFAKLSRHGVRLTDIRWDQGAGSLGDFSFLCYLYNYSVSLRIRLERVEVQCFDLTRVGTQKLTEVTLDVLNSLEGSEPAVRFKTHSLTLNLHGLLENNSAREFIARFVHPGPEGVRPFIGSGVVYYYGAHDSRLSASVTVDLSSQVVEGLLVRLQSVWDAQKISLSELPGTVEGHLRSITANFGLLLE